MNMTFIEDTFAVQGQSVVRKVLAKMNDGEQSFKLRFSIKSDSLRLPEKRVETQILFAKFPKSFLVRSFPFKRHDSSRDPFTDRRDNPESRIYVEVSLTSRPKKPR